MLSRINLVPKHVKIIIIQYHYSIEGIQPFFFCVHKTVFCEAYQAIDANRLESLFQTENQPLEEAIFQYNPEG